MRAAKLTAKRLAEYPLLKELYSKLGKAPAAPRPPPRAPIRALQHLRAGVARRARSSQRRPLLHGSALPMPPPRSNLQNLGKTAVLLVSPPKAPLSYSSDFKEEISSSKCEKKL